jgi:HlyD family secretion protein
VPVQAILGTPSMGHRRKCFVMTAEGPRQRDILVGMSNSKLAEIKEGLSEGDQIVLNPKVLLTEKDKLRPMAVDDKHSEEDNR